MVDCKACINSKILYAIQAGQMKSSGYVMCSNKHKKGHIRVICDSQPSCKNFKDFRGENYEKR